MLGRLKVLWSHFVRTRTRTFEGSPILCTTLPAVIGLGSLKVSWLMKTYAKESTNSSSDLGNRPPKRLQRATSSETALLPPRNEGRRAARARHQEAHPRRASHSRAALRCVVPSTNREAASAMMGREAEDDASDTVASRAKAFPNSRVERPKKGGGDAGHDTRAKSNLGYRAPRAR